MTFPYHGKIRHGCQKSLHSPSYKNPECRRFLHLAKKEFKVWPDIDEFEIYDETTLDNLAKCYRPSDSHGWCATNMGDDISNPQFDIKADHGWGFCTDECFPDMTQPFYGKAREKLIHILDEEFCEGEF